MKNKIDVDKLKPIYYALGGFLTTPFLVVGGMVFLIGLLLIWPFVPFMLYFQRKQELLDEKDAEEIETCDKQEEPAKKYSFAENNLPPLPWVPSNQYGTLRYILAQDNTIVLHCSHLPYDLVKAMCAAANTHLLSKDVVDY
jgi:hypothetical protein